MTIGQAKTKLTTWANAQVGYTEGKNNWNKFAADQRITQLLGWNAQNQPWCDIFCDYAFIECFGLAKAAEMTYQPIGRGTAACRTSAQFFKNNGAFFDKPEAGDIVFFYADGAINHQGIVTAVNGALIETVEGNSSDMVAKHIYRTGAKSIAGYGRPKWSVVAGETFAAPAETSKSVSYTLGFPNVKRGDKGELVKTIQLLLIGRNFSCGGYGADGDFGGATFTAVKNFQEENGLDQDGIVGKSTMQKLLGV